MDDASPELLRIADLAWAWIDASKRDAYGWGAGTEYAAQAHDDARARFVAAVRGASDRVLCEAFARAKRC